MEYIGEWWIAGTDNKCFGILKQYDNEYMLEVYDKDLSTLDSLEKGIVPIYGFTKEGKSINLFGFLNVSSSLNFNGDVVHKKYKGRRVVIADYGYYNSEEELKIKSLNFRCDFLEEWMHKSLASYKKSIENKGDMQLDIKMIDSEVYRINDFELKFKYGYKSNMNNTFTNFTWQQKNRISISFDKEKNLIEVMNYVYSFCDFLSFCIGKQVKYKEVICNDINGENISIVDNNTEEPIKNVDLWEITRSLVIYNDIKDNFENIIKQWFINRDKLQPIITKILSCEKDSKTFIVQIHFVDIVTALETFSRRFLNNLKMNQLKYNELLEKMLNSIEDKGFKSLMTKKLAYSNEPTLYERLENIFNKFPNIIDLSRKKKKSLLYKSVNIRNYYTHFGEDDNPRQRLTLKEALYSYEVYKIILKLLILEELGVNTNKIIERQNKVHNSSFAYIHMFKNEFNKPNK